NAARPATLAFDTQPMVHRHSDTCVSVRDTIVLQRASFACSSGRRFFSIRDLVNHLCARKIQRGTTGWNRVALVDGGMAFLAGRTPASGHDREATRFDLPDLGAATSIRNLFSTAWKPESSRIRDTGSRTGPACVVAHGSDGIRGRKATDR